jgi:hypothetical protein
MIELKNRFLNEPAVALGVLLALGVLVLKLVSGGALTPQDLSEVVAPIVTGLAARPLVKPAHKDEEAGHAAIQTAT